MSDLAVPARTLRSMKGLSGRRVLGLDGDAGFIAEVYFDDKSWQVRYLLVDTNNPMPRHEVLVPSASIAEQASGSAICVRLTRKQIKQCPEKEADPPVCTSTILGGRRITKGQRGAIRICAAASSYSATRFTPWTATSGTSMIC